MKQSKPLRRHTPLTGSVEKDREWRHRSTLAALQRQREQPAETAESKPRKRKPAKPTGEALARRLVTLRSESRCEVRVNGLCAYWAQDWHHRIARSQGGRWVASNGLAACRFCHTAITDTNGRRAEYVANGWVLDRHQDPLATPVLIHGRWFLLDDQGGYSDHQGVAA